MLRTGPSENWPSLTLTCVTSVDGEVGKFMHSN